MVQGPNPPQFGRQKVQLLENGEALVHSTSEIVRAQKGESPEAFRLRLVREYGVAPTDMVEITYKRGLPDYAAIEWGRIASTTGQQETKRKA